MQDRVVESAFYEELFERNPENEHIVAGYEELHNLAFPNGSQGSILDLGCGTGGHTVRLAERGSRVVGIDLTRGGVRAARERCKAKGRDCLFIVGDAENIPLRADAVDVAWTSLLLHHFPKLDKLPAELARVTRSRVVAFEPNAGNLLTWFAFNVVNRWWGIGTLTRNQRALRPRGLTRLFQRQGMQADSVHYVDRSWTDNMGVVRGMYRRLTSWLPLRYRANKFLMSFRKSAG